MKLDAIFEKFDQFADAPDAVAKMRVFVLQLAVRGRLVAQEPAEGDADALLEAIAVARKSNGSRKLSQEVATEEPGEVIGWHQVPATWRWVRLKDMGAIVGGGTPRSDNSAYFSDEGIPWLTPADLNGFRAKRILRGRRCITEAGLAASSARLLPAGSVLFSSRAPIGYVAIAGTELATNQGFKSCVPFVGETNEFLYYYLKSAAARIDREASGTTFREVSGKIVGQIPIPLPSLAEQKRIVAKVDELMALCDRLEAQQQERETRRAALASASLARFDDAPTPANLPFLFHPSFDITPADLRKSILTLAVHGKLVPQDPNDEPASEMLYRVARELTPEQGRRQAAPLSPLPIESLQYEIPESWAWRRFRDVAIIASNLVNPDDFLDFTHLAPDNIEKGSGVLLPCRTVREDKVISANHRFYPGQVVYSKIRPNLAKVVVVDFDGLCSADMYPIHALIDAFYLQRYMLSESFLLQAVKADTRVAMPKINQMELNALSVPVPPLAEQRRIVAKVEQLIALIDELETQLAASETAGAHLMEAVVAELTASS